MEFNCEPFYDVYHCSVKDVVCSFVHSEALTLKDKVIQVRSDTEDEDKEIKSRKLNPEMEGFDGLAAVGVFAVVTDVCRKKFV